MKTPLFLFLIILFGCKIDSNKEVDRNKFNFKTGSDTQLFFKNVRQSYYDLEENKAAKVNVFRFSERELMDTVPILNLAIVNNYLKDEAYLLLEPNKFVGHADIIIRATHPQRRDTAIIALSDFHHASMLDFSTSVFERMSEGYKFTLKIKGTDWPILNTAKSREAFRITMADYFRLTRIY